MNCDKLYLDAFPQQTSAGGQRYPEVVDAITDRIQRGALIFNYVGHGGGYATKLKVENGNFRKDL